MVVPASAIIAGIAANVAIYARAESYVRALAFKPIASAATAGIQTVLSGVVSVEATAVVVVIATATIVLAAIITARSTTAKQI